MISLKLTYPKLDEIMRQHEKQIVEVLAAAMQTNRAMMFDKDGADNGKKKWKDPVFRQGRPLQASGDLRRSMAPMNDGRKPGYTPNGVLKLQGNAVTIGSTLIYAKLMNDGTVNLPGGVLKPVNAMALKIPLPAGKSATDAGKKASKGAHNITDQFGNKERVLFRKSVRIPARRMNEITMADEKEWADTLANYIAEILNNG